MSRKPGEPERSDVETSSDGYAARFAGPVGAWMLSVQEGIVRRMLADRPGASVLDVGGGHGQLAVPLAEAGWDVTVLGSDPSCRRRVAGIVAAGRARFVAGDVVAPPFPERSFDVAICFRLLPHAAEWERLVAGLCRVARERVVVDYPTQESLNRVAPALFGAKKRIERNTRDWRLFSHAEVEASFADAGWAVRERAPQFFWPMVLHRALRCRRCSQGLEAAGRALGLTRRWGSPVIVEARPRP